MDTEAFSVHIVGSETGQTWAGEFKTKKFLSHRLKLRRDAIIRELLGEMNPHLSVKVELAAKLADCQVSLVEAPAWWTASNNGLDLIDDNVLDIVQGHVTRVQREAVEAVRKAAAEAAKGLKEEAKKDPA